MRRLTDFAALAVISLAGAVVLASVLWQFAAVREAVIDAAPAAGTAAVPLLLIALDDDDTVVQVRAGLALRHIGPDAVPVLIDSLSDPRPDRRRQAALGWASSKRVRQSLFSSRPHAPSRTSPLALPPCSADGAPKPWRRHRSPRFVSRYRVTPFFADFGLFLRCWRWLSGSARGRHSRNRPIPSPYRRSRTAPSVRSVTSPSGMVPSQAYSASVQGRRESVPRRFAPHSSSTAKQNAIVSEATADEPKGMAAWVRSVVLDAARKKNAKRHLAQGKQ